MAANPFFSGRIPSELFDRIESFRQQSGQSKTDILIEALSQYVGYEVKEKILVSRETLEEIFERLNRLEAIVITTDNNCFTYTLEEKEEFNNWRQEPVEVWQEPIDDRETAPSKKIQTLPRWEAEKYIRNCEQNASQIDDYPRVRFVIKNDRSPLPKKYSLFIDEENPIHKFYRDRFSVDSIGRRSKTSAHAIERCSVYLSETENLNNSLLPEKLDEVEELKLYSLTEAWQFAKTHNNYDGSKKAFRSRFDKQRENLDFEFEGFKRKMNPKTHIYQYFRA